MRILINICFGKIVDCVNYIKNYVLLEDFIHIRTINVSQNFKDDI